MVDTQCGLTLPHPAVRCGAAALARKVGPAASSGHPPLHPGTHRVKERPSGFDKPTLPFPAGIVRVRGISGKGRPWLGECGLSWVRVSPVGEHLSGGRRYWSYRSLLVDSVARKLAPAEGHQRHLFECGADAR